MSKTLNQNNYFLNRLHYAYISILITSVLLIYLFPIYVYHNLVVTKRHMSLPVIGALGALMVIGLHWFIICFRLMTSKKVRNH